MHRLEFIYLHLCGQSEGGLKSPQREILSPCCMTPQTLSSVLLLLLPWDDELGSIHKCSLLW